MATIKVVPCVISVGPTGTGLCCDVATVPPRDAGCFAQNVGLRLIWDSAAVAFLLGTRFESRLLTNNLGQGPESERLRTFLAPRVTVEELGPPLDGCPFDIVLLERASSTRRWISSGYAPPSDLAFERLESLLRQPCDLTRVYVYIEAASPALSAWMFTRQPFEGTNAAARTLVNFGDTTSLNEDAVLNALKATPVRSVLQWSLSPECAPTIAHTLSRSSIQNAIQTKHSMLLVTLSHLGGIAATWQGTEMIKVKPVSNAATVGAGGIVSAHVLTGLADSPDAPLVVAAGALQAGTAYVRNQSEQLNGLGGELSLI